MPASVQSGFARWLADASPLDDDEHRRIALPYRPFPKQREFHSCPAKYRLFGGAAGPGKSKALLMEAILQANEVAGANTLLLRRTFPELEGSLLLYFRRDVPRELYRSYNATKHTVTWLNGSTTRFGYSQTENDIYQYQSSEFLFVGIDELTHFSLRQWQFLTSRNRCPVAGAFPNMAGASNPGNIGHAWVKSLFIDKQPAAGMEPREYDPAEYAFIPARVFDNPIYASDTSYLKSLHQLPECYRRAFLDGDWSVFAGQYFTNFDPSRSVVRAETLGGLASWPRWISIDWGFEHPAAVYWHAGPPPAARGENVYAGASAPPASGADERSAAIPLKARAVTYREFVVQHLAPRDLAAAIVERSRHGDGKPERIDAIYLSPDAFSRRTDEATIAEQMGGVFAGAGLPRPVAADDDRIGGWILMYQMLGDAEWLIADSCGELIRTLPEMVRDRVIVEDIAKRDGDDAADAARYGLKSRPALRRTREPLEQAFAERVTSGDPTIRAIQARKFEIEHRDDNAPVKSRARRRWLWR